MIEYSFGMHLFFLGALWGSFSCAFSGMTKAWSFVEHGCDLHSNDIFSKWKLKADKLNPSNIDVGKQKILNPRGVTCLEWAQLPSLFLK